MGPSGQLLVVLVVGALAAACSSTTTSVNATDASARTVDEWHFPDEVVPCLNGAFADDTAARRALDPHKSPADADLDALSHVIASCVPGPTFAASVAPTMVDGYKSAGTSIDPNQEQCLQDEMANSSDDDRGLIVTGPISQMRDPTSTRSTAVGDVLHRLLDACGVGVATPSTSGTP